MRAKKPQRDETWICWSCGQEKEDKRYSRPDIMAHLQTVHKIKPPLQGKRQMLSHFDMQDSYSSVYEWIVGGVKLTQSTWNKREKDDMMLHMGD